MNPDDRRVKSLIRRRGAKGCKSPVFIDTFWIVWFVYKHDARTCPKMSKGSPKYFSKLWRSEVWREVGRDIFRDRSASIGEPASSRFTSRPRK
jgi:hypothetical protein